MQKNNHNKFLTPVTIPLWCALIAFITSIFLNYMNDRSQHILENKKFKQSLYLNAFSSGNQDEAIEKIQLELNQ